MKAPVRVAVTGAAGQIGYALLFRIASGQMLGEEQPLILQMLEVPPALKALEGVVMEIDDCAFPLVAGYVTSDDPGEAFKDADYALMVGSRPRGAGMERSDLLEANGGIFKVQGRALNDHAGSDVKVVVVGNPANTNAHTAMLNAPDLDSRNFTALTRLDHNRALAQLAQQSGARVSDIKKMTIWGNHSTTSIRISVMPPSAVAPPVSGLIGIGIKINISRAWPGAAPRLSRPRGLQCGFGGKRRGRPYA